MRCAGWDRLGDFRRGAAHACARLPGVGFPDPVSALVEMERREQFREEGAHFESAYYLTLLWMPPAEEAARAEGWLYEGRSTSGVDAWELLKGFTDRSDRVLNWSKASCPRSAGSMTPRR
jgi:type IV secretory pathway VirB4 component